MGENTVWLKTFLKELMFKHEQRCNVCLQGIACQVWQDHFQAINTVESLGVILDLIKTPGVVDFSDPFVQETGLSELLKERADG